MINDRMTKEGAKQSLLRGLLADELTDLFELW